MKELILIVKFDDINCYKLDHDTAEIIKQGLEQFMKIDLEDDFVIKSGWSVEIQEFLC